VMCWRSDRKSGSASQKIWSPPYFYFRFGLSHNRDLPFCLILVYIVPNGLPVARDGLATGRGGQVCSRDTTSGSHAVASSRIPRLRSRRVSKVADFDPPNLHLAVLAMGLQCLSVSVCLSGEFRGDLLLQKTRVPGYRVVLFV